VHTLEDLKKQDPREAKKRKNYTENEGMQVPLQCRQISGESATRSRTSCIGV